MKLYISEKIEYTQFLRESYQILDEYNDYILYNRTMEDERIRFIEQTLLKIFAYIQDNYGINMPNTFIIVFARWIYDSGMFHEILIKWKSENEQDVETLNRIMERQSTGEMVLAKEIVGLVEQNLEIELSNIEEIMLTIMLYNVKGAKKCFLFRLTLSAMDMQQQVVLLMCATRYFVDIFLVQLICHWIKQLMISAWSFEKCFITVRREKYCSLWILVPWSI